MITKELRFNGVYVDLMPNTVIALTFQAGNVGDLRTRAADFSATINIPKTNNNRKTFGNIDLINSRSTVPYRKGRVDYNQAGLNIIVGGTGIVTESSGFYKLSIYNGIIDFFGSIEGNNVDDMDFEVYETIDDTYIDSIRLSFGLFSAPVIDFGTLFPHPQELENTNFVGENGWSNEGTGEEWGLNLVGIDNLNVIFTDLTANNSAFLIQDYKFFNGFRYRITLTFEIEGVNGQFDKLDLYIGTQLVGQVPGPIVVTPGFVPYTIDETFLSTGDYDDVRIYAEAISVNPGETVSIVLKNIKITDIAGVIDIRAPYYIPLISYSQVIEKIVNDAGYILDLSMTNQEYYEKLYITFSKPKYEYPDRLINKMKFRAIGIRQQTLIITDTDPHVIEFPTVVDNGEYEWYNGLDEYQVPAWPYSIEYVVNARIIIEVTLEGGATAAEFYFTRDGVTDVLMETASVTDNYVYTFSSDVMVTDGTPKNFKLTVVAVGGGTVTVEVIESEFWVDIEPKAFGIVNLSALILPTKSQKDFIKDFLMRFGILTSEKNGVLTMVEMQKIIRESYNYVDWTAKRDTSLKESIKFEPKNYAQENIFTDITSTDVLFLGASSTINIDDETLAASKTFYTSIMAAVQQNNNNGMRLCRIELFDRTDDSPTYISSPALLYLREDKEGDSEVMYAGVVKTDFLVCVYNDPLFEFNTTWEYFLRNYYPLLEAALQRSKTADRAYNLLPADIAGLNMFRLVRDDGQVYLINKVSKYVPGASTRVEIFKVL